MVLSSEQVTGEGRDFGFEQEINPELRAVLDAHIFEMKTGAVSGSNKEKIGSLSRDPFGTMDTEIGRCDPVIDVPKFTMEAGKSVVIIGPNGSGKTTLFDAMMERRNADFSTKGGAGAVSYGKPEHIREKQRIARLNQEEILEKVGEMTAREVLKQTSEYFKAEFPVDDEAWGDEDGYEINMKNDEAQQRIDQLASRVTGLFDMDEFLDRKIDQLSGGERTKTVLFMMLASEPDILLLDEPTNHLDMESIAKLTGLFEIYKKAGVSIASVSHVDWFLREAGRDGVKELVADKESRSVKEYSSPYDMVLKDRSRSNFTVVEGDMTWREHFGLDPGNTIVNTTDRVSIPDSPLQDIEFPSIQVGEVVFLSGANGSGKTKLMEAIRRGQGEVGKKFVNVKGVNMAYMPQFWPEDVTNGTLEGFFDWIKNEANPHSEIQISRFTKEAHALKFGGGKGGRFDSSWLKRPLTTFSGGEQRLLWFLAVSTLEGIDALLLDEPTNHMDRTLQGTVTKAIQGFPGAVVISSHDVDLMKALSQSVGNKVGSTVAPRNLVLSKEKGSTSIEEVEESPAEYAEKVRVAAKKQARRFKL